MNNSPRRRFNNKRRIRQSRRLENLTDLAERVSYAGNPAHKSNPGDFGLTPPADPRDDKTLCDAAGIFSRSTAMRLLKAGIERDLISEQTRGAFPQNVWAVDENGYPLEAQLENRTQGAYHGYPLALNDPFRDQVLAFWSSDEHAL
ncbi:MAG: hypothetical protein OXU28_12615 [Chloroflexota bacterium]|nr:hypothetical protein [Chloroflexota bacterium]